MLDVPHLRQLRSWSCGPACVRMVLRYYGQDFSEADLIEALGSNERDGTAPPRLAAFFRQAGLVPHAHRNMGIAKLARVVGTLGQPCIVALQAWGRGADHSTSWDHGHYSIVIAADDRRVTLVDPSSKRPRRHFNTEDFLSRWRDIDANGKLYIRWGASIGPRK